MEVCALISANYVNEGRAVARSILAHYTEQRVYEARSQLTPESLFRGLPASGLIGAARALAIELARRLLGPAKRRIVRLFLRSRDN
jgi:hypothetical protein